MLQAYFNEVLIVGVTRKNVERLTAHQPIKIDLQRAVSRVLVVFGETKPAIIAELEANGGVMFEQSHKDAAEHDPS